MLTKISKIEKIPLQLKKNPAELDDDDKDKIPRILFLLPTQKYNSNFVDSYAT